MKSAIAAACALSLAALAAAVPALRPAHAAEPAAAQGCDPVGRLNFICGLTNAEDFLPVGGGRWLVAGSFKEGADGLYLIDTAAKTAKVVDLSIAARPDPMYPCAAPDLKKLSTHGVDVHEGPNGTATVFTINHGGREAIEVWKLDAPRNKAEWVGCVMEPPGTSGNSVVAFKDGRIAFTRLMDMAAKQTIRDVMAGQPTGTVFIWTPGKEIAEVPGTQLPGDNGLVASPDGKTLYIAAYGAREVWIVPTSGQGERRSVKLDFSPDNIRWAPDGTLFVTGQFINPAAIAGRHGWTSVRLDPKTLKVTPLLNEPGRPEFDDGTTLVQVGDTWWIGTFRGDRVAYTPAR